jgi:uncharacterized protein with ParB-like and HNH nuclease domain
LGVIAMIFGGRFFEWDENLLKIKFSIDKSLKNPPYFLLNTSTIIFVSFALFRHILRKKRRHEQERVKKGEKERRKMTKKVFFSFYELKSCLELVNELYCVAVFSVKEGHYVKMSIQFTSPAFFFSTNLSHSSFIFH